MTNEEKSMTNEEKSMTVCQECIRPTCLNCDFFDYCDSIDYFTTKEHKGFSQRNTKGNHKNHKNHTKITVQTKAWGNDGYRRDMSCRVPISKIERNFSN